MEGVPATPTEAIHFADFEDCEVFMVALAGRMAMCSTSTVDTNP
jgi:hypothetical protein